MHIRDWGSDLCSSDLNGIVHQHHVLAAKFQLDGVALLAYGFFPRSLAGHDESTTDVAVLHETLAELDDQVVRSEERRVGTECVRTVRHSRSTHLSQKQIINKS